MKTFCHFWIFRALLIACSFSFAQFLPNSTSSSNPSSYQSGQNDLPSEWQQKDSLRLAQNDSTLDVHKDETPQYVQRNFNHKEQVITASAIMASLIFVMT